MKKEAMNKIIVVILSALSIFDLFINVARFLFVENPGRDSTHELLTNALPNLILSVAMIVIALYYMIYNYRKPHGNTLRNIYIIFAFYLMVPMFPALKSLSYVSILIYFCCAVLIAFMGGRLSKFDKNKRLSAIIFILFIANTIYSFFNLDVLAGTSLLSRMGQWHIINEPIIWAVLCASYFARFRQHKEAGNKE